MDTAEQYSGEDEGERVVAWVREHLVDAAARPMTLAPWQERVVADLFRATPARRPGR